MAVTIASRFGTRCETPSVTMTRFLSKLGGDRLAGVSTCVGRLNTGIAGPYIGIGRRPAEENSAERAAASTEGDVKHASTWLPPPPQSWPSGTWDD